MRREKWVMKAVALLLVIVTMFSMTSCGGNENTAGVEYKVDELLTKMMEGLDLGYSFSPMEMIAISGEEGEYYTGIKESASLVEEQAAYITPMMGQAFQIVVVKAKDIKDVEVIKKEMKEGNDLNRWLCRTAEQLIVTSNGRHIVCVMGTKEETSKVADAFDSQFDVKSSERLIK